jgi:hypothetical protein
MSNVVDQSDSVVEVVDFLSQRFDSSLSVILRGNVRLRDVQSNVLHFFYEESYANISTFERIISSESNDLFIDFLLKFLKREGFRFAKNEVVRILNQDSAETACCSMF